MRFWRWRRHHSSNRPAKRRSWYPWERSGRFCYIRAPFSSSWTKEGRALATTETMDTNQRWFSRMWHSSAAHAYQLNVAAWTLSGPHWASRNRSSRSADTRPASKFLKRRLGCLVDLDGFEPSTSSMPWKRAPNCATGPSLARPSTELERPIRRSEAPGP